MSQNRQPRLAVDANYHAYLLRLWRESPSSSWRAWVQDVGTGERRGFASLAALLRFLCAQAEEGALPEGTGTHPKRFEEEEETHV